MSKQRQNCEDKPSEMQTVRRRNLDTEGQTLAERNVRKRTCTEHPHPHG